MSEPSQHASRRYFTEFLPGILGKLLIDDLRDLSSCFAIEVTDADDPPWRLVIESGRLVSVGAEGPEAACCFRLETATLEEVVSARVVPAEAFFDKRIDLVGDVETGLRLSTVLEPFFRRFPWPT